ncbi:MAG TPA: hypothetical protein VEB68_12385 [Croceibacterium sp.]|nr:hypothetical protein [Propylenella sp.]HYD25582.1 hypothetical protein [Croceibacterium sp.]
MIEVFPAVRGLAIGVFAVATIAVLPLTSAPAAANQLAEQRVTGLKRICIYRAGALGTETRSLDIGVGDACPAQFPVGGLAVAAPKVDGLTTKAPPTARLDQTTFRSGKRQCSYVQLGATWTYVLPPDEQCPLTVGLIEQQVAARETDQ